MTPLAPPPASPRSPDPATRRVDADEATSLALLNCAIRELCAPEQQVRVGEAHLTARLPRVGVTLRARLRRPPLMTPAWPARSRSGATAGCPWTGGGSPT